MNDKTYLLIPMYDNVFVRSDEFRNRTTDKQGKWVVTSDNFRIGNELLVPVLYPEKDAVYNATMWLTLLGFNVHGTELMGDWISEMPKIDAVKIGAFVTETDAFDGRDHNVDLRNGNIVSFEMI